MNVKAPAGYHVSPEVAARHRQQRLEHWAIIIGVPVIVVLLTAIIVFLAVVALDGGVILP